MREGTINKKSWHYRLASFYAHGGDLTWFYEPGDFCSYLWKVARGLFVIAFCMFVLFFALFQPVADLAAYAYAAYEYGAWWLPLHEPAQIFVAFLVICCACVSLGLLAWAVITWKVKHPKDNGELGFADLLYFKLHDKICFKINYKD